MCIGIGMSEDDAVEYFKEEVVRNVLTDLGKTEDEIDAIVTHDLLSSLPEDEDAITESVKSICAK